MNQHVSLAMKLAIGICAAATTCAVSAALFTPVPVPGLAGVESSAVAWADHDNDGLLDFIVTGTTNSSGTGGATRLWHNTGTTFTNVPMAGVPGVVFGSATWGDFDSDGRLDFLLTGTTNGILSGNICQLWRNTENGFENVTEVAAPGLPKVNQSAVAWIDIDNNGSLDLFIAGQTSTGRVAQIWRNTGGVLVNATATFAPGMPGFDIGTAAWGDYDNDGYVDVIIAGDSQAGRLAQLWRNNGTQLTNATLSAAAGLTPVSFASAAWGDFDRDGLLDFVLTGDSGSGRIAQIWRNTGNGLTNATSNVAPELTGMRYSSTAWIDFDNDGRLDLLLTGSPMGGAFATRILRNTGTGFVELEETLPGVFSTSGPSTAAADFDNDGRVDLLITGSSETGGIASLWRNSSLLANTVPSVPAGLSATRTNGRILLNWTGATDVESGTNLTYNVRIGTSPLDGDVAAADADAATGFRRLPALGNVQLGTCAAFNLEPGVYHASVQAVDQSLAGGAFSVEVTFTVASDAEPILSIQRSGTNVLVSWTPPTVGWILQEAASLESNWTNAPSGSTNPAVMTPDHSQSLYRLRRL